MNINIGIDEITSELLDIFIKKHLTSEALIIMKESDKYFNVKNTHIADRKKMMMLYDENDNPYIKQDLSKANNKAKHSYLQELINQCTNYLAGKPIKIDFKKKISENDKEIIDKELYINNNLLTFMQTNIKNIQLYGKTLFRIIKDEEKCKFVIYDPKEFIMLYDDYNKPILAIRYFTKLELQKNEIVEVEYVEVYDNTYKDTYVKNKKGKWVKESRNYVYATRITYDEDTQKVEPLDTSIFPIIEWRFNEDCIPTLSNIKDFIDLQDTNLSDLANNVEDIQEAIWILENYTGQNIKEFMEDLKIKKSIKVGAGGSARSETVDIPIEARNKLYDLCNKNIYKFGFGVDFSERDSLGNVSGVALKWSYAPLEQKANAIENNSMEALDNFFNILFKLLELDYDSNDLEYIFDRTMIANEQEQTATIMSASSQLSQKTILDNLPMVKDTEEEIERLEGENEYEPIIPKETIETGEGTEEEDNEGNANTMVLPLNNKSGR